MLANLTDESVHAAPEKAAHDTHTVAQEAKKAKAAVRTAAERRRSNAAQDVHLSWLKLCEAVQQLDVVQHCLCKLRIIRLFSRLQHLNNIKQSWQLHPIRPSG
jgi:hypothetical protein